jgi:hypothetical protein
MHNEARTCRPCRYKKPMDHPSRKPFPNYNSPFLDAEPIRELVKSAMIENEDTVMGLARRSGVSDRNIRGFLNGHTHLIRVLIADKLCTALGVRLPEMGE